MLIFGLEDSVANTVLSTLDSFGLGSRFVSDTSRANDLFSKPNHGIEMLVVDIDRFGEGDCRFSRNCSYKRT